MLLFSSDPMCGRATLPTVESRNTIAAPRTAATSVHRLYDVIDISSVGRRQSERHAGPGHSAYPVPMPETLQLETEAGVRSIILDRATQYNTITPTLRDELGAAIDEADADSDVHVIFLGANGPAFCAGYGLDWSTEAMAAEAASRRAWDIPTDMSFMK